jgi:hypothetical protein
VFNIPFGAVQNILHPLGRKGNAQTIRKLLIRHTQGVLQRGKRCYRILNGCHDETMTQNDFFVNCGDDNNRAVHFCQNLTILRHSGPASDSERRAGTQRKCQNAKRFVPCLKKYIGKRLRLLTVALDTGSAVAALPCPV